MAGDILLVYRLRKSIAAAAIARRRCVTVVVPPWEAPRATAEKAQAFSLFL